MNNVLFLICFTGLAVLPLAVLGLRAARPKLMPWWAVFSIVVGLGWVLVVIGAEIGVREIGVSVHFLSF
jgi:hypothetical protein